MNALNIKKGSSSHSAYELRDPNGELTESHTLAVVVANCRLARSVAARTPPARTIAALRDAVAALAAPRNATYRAECAEALAAALKRQGRQADADSVP